MMSLFLQLPVLWPLSDAFFRYLTLVQPRVEDSFEQFADVNSNKLVYADVKVILNSIKASRDRAEYEAMAKLSHLR